MPTIAVYALIVALLFGGGYGTCWKTMTLEVARLNAQITASNESAKRILQESIASTKKKEAEDLIKNKQREEEYAKNIKVINDNAANLSNVRMRIRTVHTNCSDRVSESTDRGVSEGEADFTELPGDLRELLLTKSKECDKVAVYAQKSYQKFMNNCGIKQ
jgi:hypothetical protein